MLKIKVLCFILCLSVLPTSSLYAQNEPSKESIQQFIESAHDSLEGDSHKPRNLKEFAQHWRENFNFKKVFLSAIRWSNVQLQDEKFRDHALNLALILPVSHAIEMASGPALFYAAHEAGASTALQSFIAVSGALITVPGLDPLCLVLIASYKFEPVQKIFTATRIGIYRTSQFMFEKTHMKQLAEKFLKKESRLDLILRDQAENLVEFENQKVKISYAPNGETLFSVTVNSESVDHPYIESISTFKTLEKSALREAKSWMKYFGYNARSALLEILSGKEPNGYHIQNVETIEGGTQINFKPQSLVLRPRIRLNCSDWLS